MTGKRPTAIVACMDARLDAAGFLSLWPEAVHVIRNAGGRLSDDALRSLAASCAMAGTRRVVVVHHTDCAMAKHADEQIRDLLPPGVADEVDFLTIGDPLEALRQDVRRAEESPLLPAGTEVTGFVYDLDDRTASEIDSAS